MPGGAAGAQERAGHVHVHHRLPVRQAQFHRGAADGGAGIVHQYVEPALARGHGGEAGIDLRLVGHVHAQRFGALAKLGGRFLGCDGVTVEQPDARAGGVHQRGSGQADAAGSPGDGGNPAVEAEAGEQAGGVVHGAYPGTVDLFAMMGHTVQGRNPAQERKPMVALTHW